MRNLAEVGDTLLDEKRSQYMALGSFVDSLVHRGIDANDALMLENDKISGTISCVSGLSMLYLSRHAISIRRILGKHISRYISESIHKRFGQRPIRDNLLWCACIFGTEVPQPHKMRGIDGDAVLWVRRIASADDG